MIRDTGPDHPSCLLYRLQFLLASHTHYKRDLKLWFFPIPLPVCEPTCWSPFSASLKTVLFYFSALPPVRKINTHNFISFGLFPQFLIPRLQTFRFASYSSGIHPSDCQINLTGMPCKVSDKLHKSPALCPLDPPLLLCCARVLFNNSFPGRMYSFLIIHYFPFPKLQVQIDVWWSIFWGRHHKHRSSLIQAPLIVYHIKTEITCCSLVNLPRHCSLFSSFKYPSRENYPSRWHTGNKSLPDVYTFTKENSDFFGTHSDRFLKSQPSLREAGSPEYHIGAYTPSAEPHITQRIVLPTLLQIANSAGAAASAKFAPSLPVVDIKNSHVLCEGFPLQICTKGLNRLTDRR